MKPNNWKIATLCILSGLAVGIATFLIAQESEEDDSGCHWVFHPDNLSTAGAGAEGHNEFSVPIVQLQAWATSGGYLLNQCDGSLYQIEGVESTQIR